MSHFCNLICSNLNLVEFGWIRSDLVEFGVIWSNLDKFGQIWSISLNLLWTNWFALSRKIAANPFKCIQIHLNSNLVKYGWIWLHLVRFELRQNIMQLSVWSNIYMIRIFGYISVWTSQMNFLQFQMSYFIGTSSQNLWLYDFMK